MAENTFGYSKISENFEKGGMNVDMGRDKNKKLGSVKKKTEQDNISKETKSIPLIWQDPKEKGKFYINILVKPNAKQNRIYKDADKYCIDIETPPIEGKANLDLIKLISTQLSLPKNAVRLARGHTSHQKVFIIFGENLTLKEIESRLFSN